MSNTCFLTVYILSKSGIVRTAFVSFWIFWPLHLPYLCFSIFFYSRFISLKTSCHIYASQSLSRTFFPPPLAHCTSSEWCMYVSVYVCVCVHGWVCDGTGSPFGWGGSVKNTAWPTVGAQKHPHGVWLQAFSAQAYMFMCTRESDCVNKKTKIL